MFHVTKILLPAKILNQNRGMADDQDFLLGRELGQGPYHTTSEHHNHNKFQGTVPYFIQEVSFPKP